MLDLFLVDLSSSVNLYVTCIPQEYRDNLNGVLPYDTGPVFLNALNKASDTTVAPSQKWRFFRCAVDLTNERFYLNNLAPATIVRENISNSIPNSNSYRFFDLPVLTTINIENAALNTKVRIMMKNLCVYREYIPQSLMRLQYK